MKIKYGIVIGKRVEIIEKKKGGIIIEDFIVRKYHRRFLMLFRLVFSLQSMLQLLAASNNITGAFQH